jgi:hypothetical protein
LFLGAEPSPAYFNILMHGKDPEVLDGTQLAADWTFSGLQKFGQGLEERLRGLKYPSKILEKVIFCLLCIYTLNLGLLTLFLSRLYARAGSKWKKICTPVYNNNRSTPLLHALVKGDKNVNVTSVLTPVTIFPMTFS